MSKIYECKNKCGYNSGCLKKLEYHIKLNCDPDIIYNNIYDFDISKFGYYQFDTDNPGDIYIIQPNYEIKDIFKNKSYYIF